MSALRLIALVGLGLAAQCGAIRGGGVAMPRQAFASAPVRAVAQRAVSAVHMSDGATPERETKKRRSRLATIDRVKPDTETVAKEKTENEPIWRVLLHNDDVHTFDYCSMCIVKVVKTITRKKAFKITMEAHMGGLATVTTTWKAQAKSYCTGLQQLGLTSSIAPDPTMSQ